MYTGFVGSTLLQLTATMNAIIATTMHYQRYNRRNTNAALQLLYYSTAATMTMRNFSHPATELLSTLLTTDLSLEVCVCILVYLEETDDHED